MFCTSHCVKCSLLTLYHLTHGLGSPRATHLRRIFDPGTRLKTPPIIGPAPSPQLWSTILGSWVIGVCTPAGVMDVADVSWPTLLYLLVGNKVALSAAWSPGP